MRVWDVVGRALCSGEVRDAFMRRLAPALERRFGAGHAKTGMFPIPVLTRDIPGLPDHAAHRHALEGHHRPALSAARSLDHAYRHDLPQQAARRFDAEGQANDVCAEYRLCICGRLRHVAFGRSHRPRGHDPRQHSVDLFRRCRARSAFCATAASGSGISSSARSATACRESCSVSDVH